jgi:hypothetical protein
MSLIEKCILFLVVSLSIGGWANNNGGNRKFRIWPLATIIATIFVLFFFVESQNFEYPLSIKLLWPILLFFSILITAMLWSWMALSLGRYDKIPVKGFRRIGARLRLFHKVEIDSTQLPKYFAAFTFPLSAVLSYMGIVAICICLVSMLHEFMPNSEIVESGKTPEKSLAYGVLKYMSGQCDVNTCFGTPTPAGDVIVFILYLVRSFSLLGIAPVLVQLTGTFGTRGR